MIENGTKLELKTEVPHFFVNIERLSKVNIDNNEFNKNTHKSTSFYKVTNKCKDNLKIKDESDKIFGVPQIVDLPFTCEDEILDWGIHYHRNIDVPDEFYKNLGDDDSPIWQVDEYTYFGILSVELISIEKKRRKRKGKSCLFK